MLIAREKRKENITEYIIYMWQVEDTIRAFNFDLDEIEKKIISRFDQPENVKKEIYEWYRDFAALMKNEKVEKSGHVQFLKNLVSELNDLHLELINKPDEVEYINLYSEALPLIREMNARQQWRSENEIETCLTSVYIYYLMRLKNKEISQATDKAMKVFVRLLSSLSTRYHQLEKGGYSN